MNPLSWFMTSVASVAVQYNIKCNNSIKQHKNMLLAQSEKLFDYGING